MRETFDGFSRALYSNWLWHRPLRLVIDAGEGLTLALGTNVYTPSVIAITHAHSDHVLGLPGFIGARRFGKGAPDKPYTIVYPHGSTVEALKTFVAEMWRGVSFPITWTALSAGERHPLDGGRWLEAFAVTHGLPAEPTLGYRVLETRRRLKPEFVALPPAEIERLAKRGGRDHLMETFEHVRFVHSGDAMPIDPAQTQRADVLVHDATFLGAAERRAPIHATSGEALEVARTAGVQTLVLNHLSIRYDREMALPVLTQQVTASGFTGSCWLLDEGTFHRLR